jgi:hypothetical protein
MARENGGYPHLCVFIFSVIPGRNPESRATTSGFPDAQLRI